MCTFGEIWIMFIWIYSGKYAVCEPYWIQRWILQRVSFLIWYIMVLEAIPSDMDPIGTRYLVIDYVNHRLTSRGYEWGQCPPLIDPPLKIHITMREKGDDFEERYKTHFQDLVEQLHVTQNTAYSMFKSIVEELFSGGINWGRIIALFAFGGSLAVRCVETGMPNLVDSVVEWVTTYVEHHLEKWISQHGGWVGIIYITGRWKFGLSRKSNPGPYAYKSDTLTT